MTTDPRALPIPADWVEPIQAFLDYAKARGRRSESISTFRQRLAHLARHIHCSPFELTNSELTTFLANQDWAYETRRGRLQTYRSFWEWAIKDKRTTDNPTEELPRLALPPPNPRPIPYPLYLESLLKAKQRTRLILRFAGEHGFRRGEIAVSHTTDLINNKDRWSIIAHGKGGKDRVVPLNTEIAHEIMCMDEGWIFPGDIDGHLSPRRISELAREVLPSEWSLHKLRHMFATRGYAVSTDLLSMQALLGHASPNTTRGYIALDEEKLRSIVDEVSTKSFSFEKDRRFTQLDARRLNVNLDELKPEQVPLLAEALSSYLAS